MLTTNFENFEIKNSENLICKHGLIILKNANLTLETYENFVKKIGKLLVTEKHVLNNSKTIQEVSNVGLFRNHDVDWHNDWSYGRGNYFGTSLYNVKNADLAETQFIDMSKLPTTFYEIYKGKEAKYAPPKYLNYCFTEKQILLLEKQNIKRSMVFQHPVTKENILYCSPGTIQKPHDNLNKIINYIEKICYCHKWEKNDLLLFDNLKMMHRRKSFIGDRILWRIQFTLF